MDRKFRHLILQHVEQVLDRHHGKPSRVALHELLAVATPDLPTDAVDDMVQREKAFRALKLCLHPDKHHHSHDNSLQQQPSQSNNGGKNPVVERATKLFQNVQTFYIQCSNAIIQQSTTSNTFKNSKHASTNCTSNDPHRTDSPRSVLLRTVEWDSFRKWPFLNQLPSPQVAVARRGVSPTELAYHMAYYCLNLRGAIVHGQAVDCTYQVTPELHTHHSTNSVLDVWAEAGFPATACRAIKAGVDAIKEEIMHHGPVLSTSFFLSSAYFQSTRYRDHFSHLQLDQHHPVLIVGWTMTCQGQVWLVQALKGPTFHMGMGQFQIDQTCVAPPLDLLTTKAWQSPGPYWDVVDVASKCSHWSEHFGGSSGNTSSAGLVLLEVRVTSEELEQLGDCLSGKGFMTAMKERLTFVLRDATKLAHSRRVYLRDVVRHKSDKFTGWIVALQVVRKTNSKLLMT